MRVLLLTLFLVIALSFVQGKPDEENEEKYSQDEQLADPADDSLEYYQDDALKQPKDEELEEKQYSEDEKLVIPQIDTAKVTQMLQSKEQTRRMVDCVIYFEDGCPPDLQKVNRMAPEIFRRGGHCFRCSKEDQKKLRMVLVELQSLQPGEYRRMIRELNRL